MLTALISEHFVGSLSDDVFDRDLRLKKAELKNAYLEQEQYHDVVKFSLSMLTMFLDALTFPLSPAASSIFCL